MDRDAPLDKMFLADFVYVRAQDCYVHVPTRRVSTACEIDRLFPPIPELTGEAEDDVSRQ